MQLVEDLYANPVALFTCSRVLDLEGLGIQAQTVEFLSCDHLVADIVCDVVPCFVDLGPVADVFGHCLHGGDVVPCCLVLDY